MSQSQNPNLGTLRALTAPGIEALRRYWRPFVLLQVLALLLVIGYYSTDAIRSACERLTTFRQSAGIFFAAASAAFAGALLPEVAKSMMMRDLRMSARQVRDIGFAIIAFAIAGIIIDYQYKGLAWALGTDVHFTTAIKKMLADQFICTPIFGCPYWPFIYGLRAKRYNLSASLREISPRWYMKRVMPLLIPCWGFWIPMTLLIFSLPGPLQFCLFCVAMAAWSLVMIFVANRPEPQPVMPVQVRTIPAATAESIA